MAGILRTDTIQNSNTSTIITQTNSTTITIGTSGQTVALASGASSSGFGRTGTVNWDTTKKTSGFTAVSGVGYFCDTTSTAFTATLPLSPSAGAIVAFSDYTGTWGTNNLTVGRNGSNINAAAADLLLNGNNTTATFIYVDGTEGWRIIDTGSLSEVNIVAEYVAATGGTVTCCGNYKIHTFTGPGTFTVTSAGNSVGSNSVDYLVVAGGGGGAGSYGGGGGAGGFRESKATGAPWTASPLASSTSLPVSAIAYPITVGGGGAGGPKSCTPTGCGVSGSNSVFSTITSAGGGGGGNGLSTAPQANARPGGSGGGGGNYGPSSAGTGGTGNTPPTSPSQGNNGGAGSRCAATHTHGGGGGGATAVGQNAGGCSQGGPSFGSGGAGATTSISGSPTARAGGGGGSVNSTATNPVGGTGGGGAGGSPGNTSIPSVQGTTNTGGGGGGINGNSPIPAAGTGGSGIVIIRYKFQ